MQYRRLGRTGLNVSVLSLGTGGPNRLGQSRYASRSHIRRLIGRALELGVNLFDTSGAYEQSEVLLGAALLGVPRERYFLAGKIFPWRKDRLLKPAEIRRLVEFSLQRLRVDELDLLQLHRVTPETYDIARDQVVPELAELRNEGKFRYLGITESTSRDPEHRMLLRALEDDLYDAVMAAYHPGNSSARNVIFPRAQEQDVGVICIAAAGRFVPRNAAARLRVLGRTLAGLVASPPTDVARLNDRLRDAYFDLTNSVPLEDGRWNGSGNPKLRLPEAVFTFAASMPAVASVLTGTTDLTHLERNAVAAQAEVLST